MSKFYSIPGVNPYDSKSVGTGSPVPEHPLHREFWEARRRRGDDCQTVGLLAGARVNINGVPAVVETEERDSHTGTITTVSKTDRASYVSRWKQSAKGELVMTEAKRTFE